MIQDMSTHKASIKALFDQNIILRDLEPLNPFIPGISSIREQLSFPIDYLPRKNEPDYAKVLLSFINALGEGKIKYVFYVGDSLYNDGSAIINLSKISELKVLGYICNQGKELLGEYLIGNIILSDDWANLYKMIEQGIKKGFQINDNTIGIFDLDNTTYAAKGRASEPLTQARLEAVYSLLLKAMGSARFRKEKVERAFREFDRDEYHPFTSDNLDYVVFLALIYSLGLLDLQEIRQNLSERRIQTFIEKVLAEVEERKANEGLDEAWKLVREIYFNMRYGDKTPFKQFRYKEYYYTAQWMTRDAAPENSITITREVAEMVSFLKINSAYILALSDRPVESTCPYDVEVSKSLLNIEMLLSGETIINKLIVSRNK